MSSPGQLELRDNTANRQKLVKLAIMAVGGQGGGVLASWIEAVGRANGYVVQATSVAGVAQRTGATIYYIEMAPVGPRVPVFSLAPAAGDVDILIAAELMEAGRAILRGFVTPDRTTLIASTHRALAVSEKIAPGDGIADGDQVHAAARVAAQRLVMFDMERLALEHRTVVSACLLGALAGAAALPFSRAQFEAVIRQSGKGADQSLAAFCAAADRAANGAMVQEEKVGSADQNVLVVPRHLAEAWRALEDRLVTLPEPARHLAQLGLQKVVDFQDIAYGSDYLHRLEDLASHDLPSKGYALTREAAKYLANALAYDDVIHVADLKTRSGRWVRIRSEMGVDADHALALTDFFHPRAEEIIGMLPARLGRRWRANARVMGRIERWFETGRRVRTDKVLPFLALYMIGGLRNWRMKTLRHAEEMAHVDRWLANAKLYVPLNYDLAVELIRCRRLIKGYSDTHERGQTKFDRVLAAAPALAGRDDGADWIRRLREAALQDEEGRALAGALATLDTFL